MKISLKDLSIGEVDPSPAFLGVLDEHAFVEQPVIIEKLEVGEVECSDEGDGTVIVDLSEAVEFVLCPAAFVGQFSSFVVQSPLSVHFVVFPLSLIVPAILVVEFTSSVAHASALVPLVPASSLILFYHVFLL